MRPLVSFFDAWYPYIAKDRRKAVPGNDFIQPDLLPHKRSKAGLVIGWYHDPSFGANRNTRLYALLPNLSGCTLPLALALSSWKRRNRRNELRRIFLSPECTELCNVDQALRSHCTDEVTKLVRTKLRMRMRSF